MLGESQSMRDNLSMQYMLLPLFLHLYHVKAPRLRSRFPLPVLVATLWLILDT